VETQRPQKPSRTAAILNDIERVVTEIEDKLIPILAASAAEETAHPEEVTPLNKNLLAILIRLNNLKERICI